MSMGSWNAPKVPIFPTKMEHPCGLTGPCLLRSRRHAFPGFAKGGVSEKDRQLAVVQRSQRATQQILNIQFKQKHPKQGICSKNITDAIFSWESDIHPFLPTFLGVFFLTRNTLLKPTGGGFRGTHASHLGCPNDSRTCFSKVPGHVNTRDPSDSQITLLGINILPLKLDPWKFLWAMETYINRLIRSCTVLLFVDLYCWWFRNPAFTSWGW